MKSLIIEFKSGRNQPEHDGEHKSQENKTKLRLNKYQSDVTFRNIK